MPITNWPKEDRPREKLLLKGAQMLTDAELIAIFLRTGVRGQSALDMAKALLTDCGGLKPLLQMQAHEYLQRVGIGQAKYAALKAALELGRRAVAETVEVGELLNNTRRTQAFIADQLRHHTREVFACAFLDTHLRLLCFEELFYGTVNEASVYPREIVRRALQHNAAKVILAHNHPSGNVFPSQADRDITRHIRDGLTLVDIKVVDHVIVGVDEQFSFADAGLIDPIKINCNVT